MPSNALSDLQVRLQEVQQLLDAHGALIRLKKAEDALDAVGSDLSRIGDVVAALVSSPGPGRPPVVQALNSAAIALLSAHLQGFITDLYEECASHLLSGVVTDLDSLVRAAPTRGNPNLDNINKLFATLGFPKIVDGISWKKMSNDSLKRNLREFNELRNRIVHGKSETVYKIRVVTYMNIFANFAKKLDAKLRKQIEKQTGSAPW